MPDDTTNILTRTRRAVWQAIDNWPALASRFALRQSYDEVDGVIDNAGRTGLASPTQEPTGISRFPAIAILPTTIDPAWWTYEMQKLTCLYQVQLWTARHWLPEAEELAVEVWAAVYRSAAPGDQLSYVKRATGYHPQRVGPVQFALVELGADRIRATRVQMTFGLQTPRDPFGD